jgi:hypothetical protein
MKGAAMVYSFAGAGLRGRAGRRNTTVPAAWISEQLKMANVVRCAALTAKDPDDSWGPKWKQARAMLTKMEKVS